MATLFLLVVAKKGLISYLKLKFRGVGAKVNTFFKIYGKFCGSAGFPPPPVDMDNMLHDYTFFVLNTANPYRSLNSLIHCYENLCV